MDPLKLVAGAWEVVRVHCAASRCDLKPPFDRDWSVMQNGPLDVWMGTVPGEVHFGVTCEGPYEVSIERLGFDEDGDPLRPAQLGELLSGTLQASWDEDYWSFEAVKGRTYRATGWAIDAEGKSANLRVFLAGTPHDYKHVIVPGALVAPKSGPLALYAKFAFDVKSIPPFPLRYEFRIDEVP